MKFWNYVGEFFLFRWLFGKFHNDSDNEGVSHHNHDNSYSDDFSSHDYGGDGPSFNDFYDEQDDYDMMDDL